MIPRSWTIKEILGVTTDYLKKKDIDNPRLSAEILLAYQLNKNRVKLYIDFDQPLNEKEISGYRFLIRRRINREPVEYITGTREFCSLDFIVGPEVLIPRPESELLVELVISLLREERLFKTQNPRILDLGTGCGSLAVSLAKEIQGAMIWASDISEKALLTAKLNVKKHSLEDKIYFSQGDLLEPFKDQEYKFDIILSNPPYIASEDYHSLPPEVRNYEPRLALDGHEEGMFFIEKIIREGADYLNPYGWILLEMDPVQTSKALKLFDKTDKFREKKRIRDYSHNYRVVMAQKKSLKRM